MKKIFFALFFILAVSVLLNPPHALAKKKLPAGSSSSVRKSTNSGVHGVTVNVKFRSDRKGIIANFSNLDIASQVNYTLTYSHGRIQEGAGGSLTDLSGVQTRELLFATCSSGVCRYQTGIKNARFIVTTIRTDGKKVSKSFRLRL